MVLLRNGANRDQFRMKQENELKSLLTDQQFEASDNRELLLAEILSLIAKGVPSKQIADNLNISIYTVNRHRQDILATLKVANTAAAVEIALRMNLI